jgi:hypothetical protein
MSTTTHGHYRLRVTTDADPGSVARILERFQNVNVLPRRLIAEQTGPGRFHVQVDITGVTEEFLALVTAKIGQCPTVLNAYWHYV